MKRIYIVTVLTSLAVILAAYCVNNFILSKNSDKSIKVGFIYVGDASDGYTNNFIKSQKAVENYYGEQVQTITKYNIVENDPLPALKDLADAGCDLIFTTSYGYGEETKNFAKEHPEIQFCQATCANANEEPVLENYHTFMGMIYQGRYAAGVVAGMKLKELIDGGALKPEQAKIGYVAAFPYAEVISGYTAFFLGIRSIVPEATMTVKYVDSWTDYTREKKCAEELIEEGCVIISQHSDTAGPASACEETDKSRIVYHIGYNQSMSRIAPTTYLTGSKINWEPYFLSAVHAVLENKKIERCTDANINGNDAGAGFDCGWVEMLELNKIAAADGTQEAVDAVISDFKKGKIDVFKGDYIGVNPNDPNDTYDLRKGYTENKICSAPSFSYVLKDVITVE